MDTLETEKSTDELQTEIKCLRRVIQNMTRREQELRTDIAKLKRTVRMIEENQLRLLRSL